MTQRLRLPAVAVLLAAVALATAVHWWRAHNVGPVQRGARLAASRGCLGCHGAAGRLADPDGARGIGTVPSFEHDDVVAYAHSVDEIREWILDGRPKRLDDPGGEPEPLLRMPAWRGRLAPAEVEALVAWVIASADFEPLPRAAAAGRDTAAALGCFACHGPQGRGDTPNPGSLKGYIPSWSGADFPELARDDSEIREWIRDGGPKRLRDNPVAAFFMRRQAILMPAFGDKVSEEEIRRVTAYVRWLRAPRAAGAPSTAARR
ncbi:MAG: c-type cytochrome [Betaproteobacteria bacterium]